MPFIMPFLGSPLYFLIGIGIICAVIMLIMMCIMRRMIMRGGMLSLLLRSSERTN
ncbi:hypothetical protein [Methanospirillum hungatei]|uniref:hypothetical protein n=1 Tax=Methanospirillum hungatei TaxID=2203 RepID=UPI0026EBFB13|nr:hypothetical protein [Methanospirillum hungatei]MCA1917689.1 hypothetical protein [Methanospirillum hungatei]